MGPTRLNYLINSPAGGGHGPRPLSPRWRRASASATASSATAAGEVGDKVITPLLAGVQTRPRDEADHPRPGPASTATTKSSGLACTPFFHDHGIATDTAVWESPC